MKTKILSNFILLFCLISFSSCGGEWKDGNYVVKRSPEDPAQKTLYFELPDGNAQGKVQNIKKIEKNETHIIVLTAKNQYWIVEKSNGSVIGPMSQDEYKLISFKMRINDIDLKKI